MFQAGGTTTSVLLQTSQIDQSFHERVSRWETDAGHEACLLSPCATHPEYRLAHGVHTDNALFRTVRDEGGGNITVCKLLVALCEEDEYSKKL